MLNRFNKGLLGGRYASRERTIEWKDGKSNYLIPKKKNLELLYLNKANTLGQHNKSKTLRALKNFYNLNNVYFIKPNLIEVCFTKKDFQENINELPLVFFNCFIKYICKIT